MQRTLRLLKLLLFLDAGRLANALAGVEQLGRDQHDAVVGRSCHEPEKPDHLKIINRVTYLTAPLTWK